MTEATDQETSDKTQLEFPSAAVAEFAASHKISFAKDSIFEKCCENAGEKSASLPAGSEILLARLSAMTPSSRFTLFHSFNREVMDLYAGDSGALVTETTNGCMLTHPLDERESTEGLANMFAPHFSTRFPLDIQLSCDGLLAIATLLDEFRLLHAASLLKREPIISLVFAFAELLEQFNDNRDRGDDFRWLLPILKSCFQDTLDLSQTSLIKGFEELEQSDWISSEENGDELLVLPSPGLIDLALDLSHIRMACQVQGSGESPVLFVRSNSIWRIEAESEQAKLQSIDGLSWFEEIQTRLRK